VGQVALKICNAAFCYSVNIMAFYYYNYNKINMDLTTKITKLSIFCAAKQLSPGKTDLQRWCREIFHYHFEMIHPFTDGNGRVGREPFNYLLMRSKPPYPKLLFLGKDRPEYLQALRHGNEERYAEMVAVFVELIIRQRQKVLEENFRRIMESGQRGQMRLSDFVEV